MIRITNMMQNNSLIRNLNRQQLDLDETQNQLSSGLKIRKPSDEPGIATNQMYFRSRLNEINQFQENVTDGIQRLNMVDSTLGKVGDILQRIRVLTVQASNGIYQGDKGFELEEAIGREIDEHLKAIIDLANARDATGRPMFGGSVVERLPFEITTGYPMNRNGINIENRILGVTYKGDTVDQLREIEKGEYVAVSVPGNKVFWGTNTSITTTGNNPDYISKADQSFKIDGVEIKINVGDSLDDIIDKINQSPIEAKAYKLAQNNIALSTTTPHQLWLEDVGTGTVLKDLGILDSESFENGGVISPKAVVNGQSIFDIIIQLRNDLTKGDQEKIGGKDLGDIDLAIENILRYRSTVGARTNRLEEHDQKLGYDKMYTTELLAQNEGIDFPETIMNLKWLETIHNYALNVGSKIIKPSLMDFLR